MRQLFRHFRRKIWSCVVKTRHLSDIFYLSTVNLSAFFQNTNKSSFEKGFQNQSCMCVKWSSWLNHDTAEWATCDNNKLFTAPTMTKINARKDERRRWRFRCATLGATQPTIRHSASPTTRWCMVSNSGSVVGNRNLRCARCNFCSCWCVESIYLLFGCPFGLCLQILHYTGFKLQSLSDNTVELRREYDAFDTPHPTCGINTTANANRTCEILFTVHKDMTPPILVHYEIENFHQNHRNYAFSLDNEQVRIFEMVHFSVVYFVCHCTRLTPR